MAELNLPAKIRAGDTLKFKDTLAKYSAADGWVLKYALVNPDSKIALSSSASGASHQFNVALTSSKEWRAGVYRWQAYVDGVDSEKHTVGTGQVTVLPDFSQGPSDQRHHVEKVLAAIEATLEGKASDDAETAEINGLSIKRYSPEQLLVWRAKYRGELNNIKRAERISNGLGGGRIGVRF